MASKPTCGRRRRNRSAAILAVALAIMLAVALLASQGLRLMMLARTAHEQRQKSAQLNELLTLGQLRLADKGEPEKITVQVPSQVGLPDKPALIEIDKRDSNDGTKWHIIVRYPYNQPGEATVTWESHS